MAYLDHLEICNRHDLAGFRRLRAAGMDIGLVRADLADALRRFDDVIDADGAGLCLNDRLADFEGRSAAVAGLVDELAAAGRLPSLRGEMYPVAAAYDDPPLLQIDRAAVPPFGILGYGVHVNGFQRRAGGRLHMWIGRRGANQTLCPGMLDNMVAGGLPIGLSPLQNVIKECNEEAGIPAPLAGRAKAAGRISYVMETEDGLRQDTMFCFDLELPTDFTPVNRDGEVAEFMLMPVQEVMEIIRDSFAFKFNCPLVILDFLIRHGILGDDEPEYAALRSGLRGGL
ncbi:MAG: DUF4743 domain-containing protein [Rhodospirillales bacterium]|jgi:8-oxo-dGTP pyrophosphatase MutT (NUDIX family)|nr:DUF4743 domain-containing protein [Rhodospirillales bacterium]MDP6645320.1 DUF4743 domain-containing protein [Rhodospirillales bacterium]|tara:strand:- start:113 stop:967 length:855 start_codon:yes stop_codon:yes gene_type:complete